MNPAKKVLSSSVDAQELQKPHLLEKQQLGPQTTEPEQMTFGQRLADKVATKVGSWTFINVQTGILAAWVGLNMMPGVPHWDQSPFILLNLVFSFASAYTAPVVLMSQNRQSEVDRKKAEIDYQVNQNAGQNIELLLEKMDSLQSQQLKELTQIVKKQQCCLDDLKVSLVSTRNEVVPVLNQKTDNEFPNKFSANKYFGSARQPIGENSKVFEKHIHQI